MRKNIEKTLEEEIDELLRNNKKLKNDVVLLNAILENISSGVAMIDESGKFLLYNQEFLRIFGLSEDSTIINVNSQQWGEWKVYDENSNLLDVDNHPVRKAALTGEKVKNQIVGMKLPSGGDMIWMLVSAEPVKGEDEENTKIICTYQDITKSKLADEYLLVNEDRLRITLESADLGTWDFDIESGIAHHDLKHDQIFGYTEIQSEWSYEISVKHILPEYHQTVRDAVAGALDTGVLYYEAQIAWPDGNIHWIASKGRVLYGKEGRPIRMIGVVSDITGRKKAEQILKENESRLSELNQTKDKFFSIIAHDLRSPFTSIMGFSELLSEKINNKDYTDIDEYAKMIHRSSRSAMELLSNLFEWSKVQTGSIEFNPKEIDIVSVIHDVLELLSYAAWHKSIKITTNLPETLKIRADKHMISSVLRNLISNAIKFTFPQGGIVISAIPAIDELGISISDNGVGISKADIDKLFRLDAAYSYQGTNGEKGSGLGLILCKEFISKHGGRIWVDSELKSGSTFHFKIPL